MEQINKQEQNLELLGHLGLVGSVIEDIKLVERIDELIPVDKEKGAKLTMGERIKAMIFNGLGFTDSRLYMFSDFLQEHSMKRLFGENVTAEMFNDDSLGRCLDAVYEYGPTKFFFLVASDILKKQNLLGRTINIDTTSIGVFGKYDEDGEDFFLQEDPSHGMKPAHGYSKDGRPQFKQMVLNLAVTGAAGLPLYMESKSGNASDKKELTAAGLRMQALLKDLKQTEVPLFIGDSAMFDSALKNSDFWKFLSRAPESHKKVKEMLQAHDVNEENWVDLGKGYKQIVKKITYKNVTQRWAIIYSQQAYEREIKTFQKNLVITREAIEKKLWHLSNEVFKCEADAHKEAKKFDKKNNHHFLEYTIEPIAKYEKSGKPKPGQEKKIVGYQIKGIIKDNEVEIQKTIAIKGKFILSTNELNETILADQEFLKIYKEQAHNERGFAFIKNNAFEVSSVFLKKPSRISALMAIMTLCLMVYGLSQYMLRKKLEETGDTLPNQLKKPTQKPSMQFIFTRLRSVHVIYQRVNGILYEMVSNLGALAKKIIGLFGPTAMRIYGIALPEPS